MGMARMARMARGRRVGECSELSIPGREHILFHPLLTASASTSQTKPLNLCMWDAQTLRFACSILLVSESPPGGKKKSKTTPIPLASQISESLLTGESLRINRSRSELDCAP